MTPEDRPFVVLDTNIWIGFCAGREAETEVLQSVVQEFDIAYTSDNLVELSRVLGLGHIVANSDDERRGRVQTFVKQGTLFEVSELIDGVLEDESDHQFLEAAVVSKAQFLITQNTRHFGHLEIFEGTQIVTAQEFNVRNEELFHEIRAARVKKCRAAQAERERQARLEG